MNKKPPRRIPKNLLMSVLDKIFEETFTYKVEVCIQKDLSGMHFSRFSVIPSCKYGNLTTAANRDKLMTHDPYRIFDQKWFMHLQLRNESS